MCVFHLQFSLKTQEEEEEEERGRMDETGCRDLC